MKISPCAKINLGLNVVNKRPDGYHDLETVFYPVAIHDEISIEETVEQDTDCTLEIKGQPIEGDPGKNLVVRAYRMVAKHHPLPSVHITLTKNIPMQAGMGGGSADCAYTIRLLNEQFNIGMNTEEMEQYAAQLGADCAFFITARPSYAEGIGERLSPVDIDLKSYCLAIVKPPIAVSTREAFALIKPKRPAKNCREIVMQPVDTWREELKNDFEESIFPQYPALADIKQRLYDMGAIYAAMSGSGSALFGIFKEAPTNLPSLFPDCFTTVVRP